MSKKIIVVAGFGPGISSAVAERFGKEGFAVALIARNEERLAASAKALRDKGIEATPFRADLSEPRAVRAAFEEIRKSLGPITVVHWNGYSSGAGDLTTSGDVELATVLGTATVSLVAAVQTALPDLRKSEGAAVLVTNGAFGLISPETNAACIQYGAMGLGVANAAKQKLVALLADHLKADGVHVAEVIVAGMVKGTAFDSGHANLDPKDIGARFWNLYTERSAHSVIFAGA